jgi:hypothetical protein
MSRSLQSAVVGFLAALDIDANKTYRELTSYTGHVSELVRILRIIMAERAGQ